ncbi:hypothetical protein E8D34_11550 [Nocardioides sp. GY 10113]|uniref:hypothetical protein n=1 Tax=Nocardioides sp. GY 10113 TaxID=2569761 RepID=UPI0010A7B4C3|nr:hypothetical protein [Nocardioides sp. GY 10113]TIC86304.1 hypothetical protein E8D34_11550 [Nocardioides sp. GY 10113]
MPPAPPSVPTQRVHLARAEPSPYDVDAAVAAATAAGAARVGIDGLLGDLSRRARRTLAPHPRLLGGAVDVALTWEAADRRDPHWYPQGVTHSGRTGTTTGLLLVAWYHKGEAGSRFTVLDPDRRRYQHVLLAEPVVEDGEPRLRPLRVHAGGLVWHGRHLHVAATRRGFLSACVDDVLRLPEPTDASADRQLLGLHPAGHRYVLPVRHAFRAGYAEGTEPLRYSFLSLDRSDPEPALVVGEYGRKGHSHRLARFPADDATGLLPPSPDGFHAVPDDRGTARMQGVAVADGVHYVTTSEGHRTRGTVHVGRPGDLVGRRGAVPAGPEDLTWWPATGMLWTATEHPRRRWVIGMRKDRLDRWADRARRRAGER